MRASLFLSICITMLTTGQASGTEFIRVIPLSLSQSVYVGEDAPSQSFQVSCWSDFGYEPVPYSISEDVTWLSCDPTSGTSGGEYDPITVNYITSGLSAGFYSAMITLSVENGIGQTIRVTLTVNQKPVISRQPTSLSNSCPQDQKAASQSFEVWNSGGVPRPEMLYQITDNVTWLSCTPTSGTSTGEHDSITVNYSTSGLGAGTYSATITISSPEASNSPQTIPVSLTVTPKPAISRQPSSLSNSCQQGLNAPLQSFEAWNSGGGTLSYSITDNRSWLSCTPTTGTSTGEHDSITVNYITSGLTAGNYSATITISDPNAINSPQTIPVNLAVQGSSTIRYVDGSVGSSGNGTSWATAFKTIQEGIDASFDGDTVIVAEGTYVENIQFNGENIVLKSTNPLDANVVANTIIDGSDAGSVVTLSGTETKACVLSGFTIQNGNADYGGGIYGGLPPDFNDNSDATIQNNTIAGNSGKWSGGVAFCDGLIQNNTITSNYNGGLAGCNGTIQNNVISGNWGEYGAGLFSCNGGLIRNNTITANDDGVISCNGAISNCIIWANTREFYNISTPTYSCIQNWTGGGEGNIAQDPQFIDLGNGDYHLSFASPCVDAGKNEDWMADAVDLDGNPRIINGTADMGAYEHSEMVAHPCDDNEDLVIDDWELLRAIDTWAEDERKNGWPQNLEDYDWALLELIDLWAPGTSYDPNLIDYW